MTKKSIPIFLSFFALLSFHGGLGHAATITVTEQGDSFNEGKCSLRDAVQSVNQGSNQGGCNFTGAFGADDTINLEGGSYTLSLPGDGENDNQTGDLDVLKPVVIQGTGPDLTIVTGGFPAGQEDRIFDLCPNLGCETNGSGTEVLLSNLTVSKGVSLDDLGGGVAVHEPFQPSSEVSLRMQDCAVRDNVAEQFTGGGIATDGGVEVFIERCMVTGNRGTFGGGIFFNGDLLTMNESTVDNNEVNVSDGGGIYQVGAEMLLYNSTISNNRALPADYSSSGGGIFISRSCESNTVVVNSTVSGNQSIARGGGIYVGACNDDTLRFLKLGGVGGQNGLFIFNGTIAFNETLGEGDVPGQGGGIYFNPVVLQPAGIPGTSGVGLYNTLVAQNGGTEGPDCFGTLDSGGFNLIGADADCAINAFAGKPDQTNVDPLLGPLQDNGGPTQTHALLDNSPAIDRGNNLPGEGCQAIALDEAINNNFTFFPLTRDQRNFPRPIAVLDPADPICDVGAFEFQAFEFGLTKDDGLNGASIGVGESFTYTIAVTNNGPGTATAVTLDDPLPGGMSFASVASSQGTCTGGSEVTCELGDLAAGETATISVAVTASEAGSFTNIATVTLNSPSQAQLSQTAQVTTTVTGGGLLEGAGFHCGLQKIEVASGPRFSLALVLMALGLLGAYALNRRRVQR